MTIRRVRPTDRAEWLRMRRALWPECEPDALDREMDEYLAAPPTAAVFVAERPDGRLAGFLEAETRAQAEGCETRPVGYIEGWYVDADVRRQGVGRRLVEAAESWARGRGYAEMASDCVIDNETSLRAHTAIGYRETVREIHFRKPLADGP